MRRLAALVAGIASAASAQVLVDANSAAELLRDLDPQASASLRCDITPVAPTLSFSLRFQTGYLVRVPLSQFHGPGHSISVLLRVTPAGGDRQPVYLLRTFDLPDVPDTEFNADLAGVFLAGEGGYQSNAIVFDDLHRACRGDWRIEVKTGRAGRERVVMPANQVAPISTTGSGGRTSGAYAAVDRMTIFLHAAPLHPKMSNLQASDVVMLTSSLAALLEELPARAVRLVIFSLEQQKELYRIDGFTSRDLERVTHVLDELQLGLVDYGLLQRSKAQRELLRTLIHREVNEAARADEVIFLGPDGSEGGAGVSALDAPAPGQHFFYLQYRLSQPPFGANRPARRMAEVDPSPPFPCQASSTDGCGGSTVSRAPLPSAVELPSNTPSAPDAIAGVVRKLKGKILAVRTAGDFSKAVDRIGRPGR